MKDTQNFTPQEVEAIGHLVTLLDYPLPPPSEPLYVDEMVGWIQKKVCDEQRNDKRKFYWPLYGKENKS